MHQLQLTLMVKCEFQEAMASMNVQFVADAQPVILHRLEADVQKICDLFRGAIFGNQFEDAPLRRCQPL